VANEVSPRERPVVETPVPEVDAMVKAMVYEARPMPHVPAVHSAMPATPPRNCIGG
jgi:hypothetical protein